MPLLTIWKSNPTAIDQFSIEQVVAAAGDGVLKDGSHCSAELRTFLSEVPSTKLKAYIERCLSTPLNKGGMILQDLVNELGRRLEYKVENGRYQGVTGSIGFDGLWRSAEHTIIVEVKTTDAYRISLNTIVAYRDKLTASGALAGSSSFLIITGREDTGELEAQVRGSRHAWDIRLISTDALLKLVQLKEDSENLETGAKIRSLLTPIEYTRLDGMIDVMFTTTKDVANATESDAPIDEDAAEVADSEGSSANPSGWEFTDRVLLQKKRNEVSLALSSREKTRLIAKTLATFWSSDHEVRAVCSISKRYAKRQHPYWYAYHPRWMEFLKEGSRSFVVLACMDRDTAYAIPAKVMHECLPGLRTTEDRYWHIDLTESSDGHLSMYLAKTKQVRPLASYAIALK